MLENRPEDALVSLVETVETVETETDCHLMSCLIVIYVQSELRLFYEHKHKHLQNIKNFREIFFTKNISQKLAHLKNYSSQINHTYRPQRL